MLRIRPLRFSSLVAICSLAAVVGSFGASLVLLDVLVLHPIRVEKPQELLHLSGLATNIPGFDPEDWWLQAGGLQSMGFYETRDAIVDAGGQRRVTAVALVSPGHFEVLRHTPVAGRLLTEADARTSGMAAVVSHAFAHVHWNSPREAVGAELRIEGIPHVVVGVVGQGAELPRMVDVWALTSDSLVELTRIQRAGHTWAGGRFGVVGRLAPHANAQVVQQQLDTLLARLNTEVSPRVGGIRFGDRVRTLPLEDVLSREPRATVWSFVAASVVGVLLAGLTCGLLIANQQLARQREWAMRQALGATPRHIRREVMQHAALWAATAACVGFAAMHGFLRLVAYIGESSGVFVPVVEGPGRAYLIVAGLAAAIAAVLIAVLPALFASRIPLAAVLNDRRPIAGTSWALRGGIVGLQSCLGLVILVGAAFATRDVVRQLTFDSGHEPRLDANVVTLRVPAAEPSTHAAAWDAVWHAATRVPAIDGVVLLSELPVRPAQGGLFLANQDPPVTVARRFYRGRFDLLFGIPTLEGSVPSDAVPVTSVLLSRSAAATLSESAMTPPVIRFDGSSTELAVLGVLDDVRFIDVAPTGELTAYVPIGDATALSATVRVMSLLFTCRPACGETHRQAVLAAVGPYAEPLGDVSTLRALYEPATRPARARAALANVYGAVALMVVLAGVHTLSGAVVLGSAFEAGMRLALGAQRADVVVRLVTRVCTPAAVGIAAGAVALLMLTQSVTGSGERAPGAMDLSIAATLLLVTAACAASGPALFLVRQPIVSLLRREG